MQVCAKIAFKNKDPNVHLSYAHDLRNMKMQYNILKSENVCINDNDDDKSCRRSKKQRAKK